MRQLNKDALYVIGAVQGYKKLKTDEKNIGMCDEDIFSLTEKYFKSIPKEIMEKANIIQNRYDFELLLQFRITEEIDNCDLDNLNQYDMF